MPKSQKISLYEAFTKAQSAYQESLKNQKLAYKFIESVMQFEIIGNMNKENKRELKEIARKQGLRIISTTLKMPYLIYFRIMTGDDNSYKDKRSKYANCAYAISKILSDEEIMEEGMVSDFIESFDGGMKKLIQIGRDKRKEDDSIENELLDFENTLVPKFSMELPEGIFEDGKKYGFLLGSGRGNEEIDFLEIIEDESLIKLVMEYLYRKNRIITRARERVDEVDIDCDLHYEGSKQSEGFLSPIMISGSKRAVRDLIKLNIPKDFKKYCEPFFGGGNIYFNLYNDLPIDTEIILNDLDNDLINLWLEIKNNPEELFDEYMDILSKTKKNYEKAELMYNKFILRKKLSPGEILFINRNSYNAATGLNIFAQWNYEWEIKKQKKKKLLSNILEASDMLENTKLTNKDYTEIMNENDENALYIIDAPYRNSVQYKKGNIDYNILKEILIKKSNYRWVLFHDLTNEHVKMLSEIEERTGKKLYHVKYIVFKRIEILTTNYQL